MFLFLIPEAMIARDTRTLRSPRSSLWLCSTWLEKLPPIPVVDDITTAVSYIHLHDIFVGGKWFCVVVRQHEMQADRRVESRRRCRFNHQRKPTT